MDNGLITVNLSNPTGSIAGIKYQGIDNVLETTHGVTDRGSEIHTIYLHPLLLHKKIQIPSFN